MNFNAKRAFFFFKILLRLQLNFYKYLNHEKDRLRRRYLEMLRHGTLAVRLYLPRLPVLELGEHDGTALRDNWRVADWMPPIYLRRLIQTASWELDADWPRAASYVAGKHSQYPIILSQRRRASFSKEDLSSSHVR